MNFATWLTGQTGHDDATGRVALAVANQMAEGWTPGPAPPMSSGSWPRSWAWTWGTWTWRMPDTGRAT
jgi:hypothetical protein